MGLGPTAHLPALGIHPALGYLATEFRWWPPWLGGPDPASPFTSLTAPSPVAFLVVPVVLIGADWGVARRRKRAELVALTELLAVAVAGGVLALALLNGPAYPYLFLWRIPIGAATVVLSTVVLVEALPRWRHRAALALGCVLAAVTLVASVSFTRTVAAADGPVTSMEPVAASIFNQLHREGQPRGPVLLRVHGFPLGGLHAALVDQLVREGAPVYVDQGLGYQFGYHRTAGPSRVGSVWYVMEESELFSVVSRLPGAQILAVSHPLPARQQAELVALQRRLADQLVAEGRGDQVGDLGSEYVKAALAGVPGLAPADLTRLRALNRRVVTHTCLCSVIAFPANRIPASLVGGF